MAEPVRLFDADPDLDDRRRPDILIRNPRGFDRQVILDVAVTGVDMFGRVTYDDPYKPLEDRFKQKINKYLRVANQNGLQLIPAVFSHTGQMHGEVKRFIKDQIRLQLTYTEGEPKSSKVELAFRWWSKCISSVISRTASRNVLFSSARISKALNVDRVPPLNDGPQHGTQFGSSSDDLQAFIDEFDLMISNQDAMQL